MNAQICYVYICCRHPVVPSMSAGEEVVRLQPILHGGQVTLNDK